MRNRRAILFFLALCGAAAAVLLLLPVRRSPSASVAEGVSVLAAEGAETLEIDRMNAGGGRERLGFVRTGGRWRMDAPIAAEADEASVKRLVDALAFSARGSSLSGKDMYRLGRKYRDFGLAEPAVRLTVSGGGRKEVFAFGRQSPRAGEFYAREIGDHGVFVVPAQVVAELNRAVGEFRRRRLFAIAAADVVGLGVRNADGAFTKIARTGGSWRLTEPANAPADSSAANALVEALCSAEIAAYADIPAGAMQDLDEDEGCVVSLRGSLGELERVVFGRDAGEGQVWARTPENAVVRVDASLKARCLSGRRILEDTRMFPVDPDAVVGFSVAEGFPAYMVSRASVQSPWKLVSPVDAPADQEAVEKLLAKVLAIRGADVAGPDDSRSCAVSVGSTVTNFPACQVPADLLADGFRLPDLRDKTVIRYPAAKIRKIVVNTAAGAEWDSTGSSELVKALEKGIAAQSVAAVSPSAEDFAGYGFLTPSYTVNFTLDDETSALRRLLIGAAAPGGGRYVAVGGSDAVFAVSADTVSVLTRPAGEVTEEQR